MILQSSLKSLEKCMKSAWLVTVSLESPRGKIFLFVTDGNDCRFAYVEFVDREAIHTALQMNGQKLLGYPVAVQETMTEKNRAAEAAAGCVDHHIAY